MRPIVSMRHLASLLGTPAERLREIAADTSSHYETIPLRYGKNLEKVRQLRVPTGELKEVQSRVHQNILAKIPLAAAAHGGVRGCSPRTNAQQHVEQDCLVTLDVEKFFDKIRNKVVYRMFRHELEFGRDVARLLTHLVTLDGRVPQGAPTSTAVANLVLAEPIDTVVTKKAAGLGVRYTRFVDDIALSGSGARTLIATVGKALSRRGLSMHRPTGGATSKLKISTRSRAQEVTGLTVNSGKPSVPRRKRENIRAAIFELRGMPGGAVRTAVRSIRGRIAYVRPLNPGSATYLEKYLETTLASLAVG